MEKRTLLAVVLFLVLGIGAYSALRAPEKGERHGPPPRPFPTIKATDVIGLEVVSQKGDKTTLGKKDGVWRITSPADYAADPQAVKSLTEAIEKVTFADVVTENPDKHDDLGVSDKESVHIKIITASQSPEVILGKPVSGFTMIRLAGKNEVWQATGLSAFQANKGPKDWRDHGILTLTAADIDKLTVEVPGGSKIVLQRDKDAAPAAKDGKTPPPVAHWKIVESTGDAPKDGEAFDPSQPQTVLQALQTLRAADFTEGKSAKDAGLDPPQLVVTASGGGADHGLEIGTKQGDDFFVRAVGRSDIFVVRRYAIERAMARPIDYRDKTLAHFKADELTRVRIEQGKDSTELDEKDGKWTLAGGGALDEKKGKALLAGFEALYGSSFVTDKATKTELDKPRAVVTVWPKTGDKVVIKIGAPAEGGDYYASRESKKDVLVVKKFAIDRLLKKPADLAPAPAKK